ncbi:MAG: hypothetical protein JRE13_13840 [Deltaproteobacteria bacterium]|nr:hypothetical protein [Deltaproteobacteria bacterium]
MIDPVYLVLSSGFVFGDVTYTLYDVSTPIPTLVAGGDGLVGIHDDLGSGAAYSADVDIPAGTFVMPIAIPLLSVGVQAVESALGGMLAIGGAPTGTPGNYAFAPTNERDAVLYIQLEDEPPPVPALSPPSIAVLALLLLGSAAFTLRRVRGEPH